MANDINIYGKFKSATASGKLIDYSAIDNAPDIIEKPEALPTEDSVPVVDAEGKTRYKKVSELGSGSSIISATITPVETNEYK